MSAEYLHKLFNLDGRVAVVIGGTGELGGAFCLGLAQAGAKVVVAGRGEEAGAKRAAEIEAVGGEAIYVSVDVTKRESIQCLLDKTLEQFGRVDILINSAGANNASTYFDVDDDAWRKVLDINLTATHWGCQIFGKHMAYADHGGAILNIGSVSSDLPLSRVFAYSASKAAVLNLTQNVARELAPFGVRVNCLCPGFFPAEQNRQILDATRIDNIMRKTPMKRFGEPEELVGAMLLALAPVAGSFMTGAAVYVDGGFTSTSI